ncbi:MAG: hypothetical protein U0Q16_06095 [Bryobacteraceae bacterium]
MKPLALLAVSTVTLAAAAESRTDEFQQRVRRVIETNAAVAKPPSLATGGYQTIAAKLWLRQDAEWCSRKLIQLLEHPSGDMFWMFPVTAVAYLDRGQLSAEARAKLRDSWRTYMPYRGDTENHWLLYYSTLYLMSQLWHDQPGSQWYTGKSSAENMAEAREYIDSWIDLTVTKGQGEYDCTHYIGVYLLPLSYLAAWSEDPRMKERARRMLDWAIADYAAESLEGIYVGAHARTDDNQVLEKWNGVSSDFGWILFGQGYPLPGFSYYGFFYTASSAYQPPAILERIATDRSRPYLHREHKRTRNRWRFADERHGPVYKTTYMHRDYAVSSDQGGILQPIQQHSWDVTWALADPRGVANTIFSMHPYSSPFELQTYFPGMPDFITESVVRSKKSYDSPDKLLGGSPYEKIVQSDDAVVALYDIPAGTRHPHINGFFPAGLAHFEEHASGWIFARGGNAWIAYRPLAPYEWKQHDKGQRLYSPHLKNGTIVQAAAASEFADIGVFRDAILALPLSAKLEPTPSVTFRTLRGHAIAFTWGQTPRIDDKPIDYARWKMFEGPFVNSEYGSRRLTLTHGGERLEVDLR